MSVPRTADELRALSEHLLYEMRMLFAVTDRLRRHDDGTARLPTDIENACVESFTVHARVLIDFLWRESAPNRKPYDGFAADYFATGAWALIREPMDPLLEGLLQRVGAEIVHLSYKRTTIGEAAKPIECEVMAADIGKCLHTFVERVPSELLAEGFDAGWQRDASRFLAVGGPIFVATASLQDPKLVTAWTAAAPDAP